jgi:hypothetical protein
MPTKSLAMAREHTGNCVMRTEYCGYGEVNSTPSTKLDSSLQMPNESRFTFALCGWRVEFGVTTNPSKLPHTAHTFTCTHCLHTFSVCKLHRQYGSTVSTITLFSINYFTEKENYGFYLTSWSIPYYGVWRNCFQKAEFRANLPTLITRESL